MKNCIKESSHFAAGKDHISSFILIEKGGRTYDIIDSLLVFLWNIKETLIPYLNETVTVSVPIEAADTIRKLWFELSNCHSKIT